MGTTDAISVWHTDELRELTTIAGPRAGGVTRVHFLNADTLVGWIGTFRSHPDDEIAVWTAPTFEQLAAANHIGARR